MSSFNVSSLLGNLARKQARIPWHTGEKTPPPDREPQKKILFVCTGNIARSACAKYLARQLAGTNSPWVFDSAGTGAVVGAPVAEHIDRELENRGIDFHDHSGQQITHNMVAESALVLVMEKEHLNWISREWPQYRSRVHLLGQMSRLRQGSGKRVDPVSYLRQHDAAPLAQDDIADPYRRGKTAAQQAVARIEKDLSVIVPWLGR